jgi:guanylate kinase
VGKGTVVREVVSRIPDRLVLSVSATTRRPRPSEVNEIDYLFVDDEEFDAMIARGDLLEWAEVFGRSRYGTPAAWVRTRRAGGADVILEIDVEGARQIRERDEDAVLILLEPPSMEELERRLRTRGSETDASIAERLAKARWELAQRELFDHIVVNDDLQHASSQVAAIIEASRSQDPPAADDDPTEDPPG